MTVFVCLDDNFGMMFNNRRQSRDSVVIEKIKEMSKGGKLFITPFSEKLFDRSGINITEDIFNEAAEDDYCFVEDIDLTEYQDKISTLVLFKWNKVYPSDKKLSLRFDNLKMRETFDFEGTSHEKITCEVWVK